ncbi:MAG: MaoC family dehydratase [Trueperaceae bacterium]|nr:MAG: MaoC family dehydratase [Trueperaceae bacterium]
MAPTFETFPSLVGKDLGVSSWLTVGRETIQAFADCTGDHQWIHIDEARAKEGPFGTTIAHGYLTLSLLPRSQRELAFIPADVSSTINYGLDKVRFLQPVPSGARIRNHVRLLAATPKGEGRLLIKILNTVELEGSNTPAMVAETLTLLIRS